MTLAAPDDRQGQFALSYRDIFEATKIISGRVLRTPTLPAPKLSQFTGAQVFVKYENLQVTGSFKDRGALVKLLSLSEAERRRGVIAMSAGNHAQAVAFHTRRLGIPALIVMPEHTPFVKIANTEAFGAEVVLAGETLAEAREKALALGAERGLTFVHPYDDPHVIAGQGTLGAELLEDQPDLDCAIMPIGGGGMIAGCAIAMKKMKPDIEIFGVEAALYPSMKAAIDGVPADLRRANAGRGHCGESSGRADDADHRRAGLRHHPRRRAADRMRGFGIPVPAEDDGRRCGRGGARRADGGAGAVSRAKSRACSVRRQY